MSQINSQQTAVIPDGEIAFMALYQAGVPSAPAGVPESAGMAFMPAAEVEEFQAALKKMGVVAEVLDFGAVPGEDFADAISRQPSGSPTGRLNVSQPDMQYIPGSFEDRIQRRRREAVLQSGGASSLNFIPLEARIAATLQASDSEPDA